MSRLFIEVTSHAVDQLRDRFPEHAEHERWQNRHLIAAEVLYAIQEQRTATKIPRWAHLDGRYRGKAKRNPDGAISKTMRFLWTLEEDRVYLVDRKQAHATVITTIRPPCDNQPL